MNGCKHNILLVDDEEKILHSLNRLLRKEGYQLFTASSGAEALRILEENEVHLAISDQRMPQMSGTEFFASVKDRYPDMIRIILTGYTEVDSITESINKGHIYKFLLKPWNDQGLKLEIRKALDHYDLIQANKQLHEKVLKQNQELKKINENLGILVRERTRELEMQNKALELSRAILEDLSLPIIGVGIEGIIVLTNREAESLSINGRGIKVGEEIVHYFSNNIIEQMESVLKTNVVKLIKNCPVSGISYDIAVTSLTGKFKGKGVIVTLRKIQ